MGRICLTLMFCLLTAMLFSGHAYAQKLPPLRDDFDPNAYIQENILQGGVRDNTNVVLPDKGGIQGEIPTNIKENKNTKTPTPGSSNKTTGNLVLNGCGEGSGLFSGLVKTGSEIFLGLRDLIYVVAGFGIIGVAVGGFFGNLNWKWLGAIIIGLIVIASTGEIIATVTDCKQFTSTVIQDTLK